MTDAWLEPDLVNIIFVGVCGACLGLAGLLAEVLLRGRRRALAVPTVSFGLAAGAEILGQPEAVCLTLAALGGLVLASRVGRVRRAWGRAVSVGRDPRWLWACLLVAAPALAFWRAGLVEAPVPSIDGTEAESRLPLDESKLKEERSVLAFTDKGRRVPLFRADPGTLEPGALLARETTVIRPWALSTHMIRTEQPDLHYNCHGWTFAGGHFWVRGKDVDLILADNGYRPVKAPRPGDLAVYLHEGGNQVMHSGVVRVAGADGVVLVESKWGWLGRYIHTPEAQYYGRLWVYYRSARPGHLLRGLEDTHQTPPPALKAALSAAKGAPGAE
jgi:hypothetical protein